MEPSDRSHERFEAGLRHRIASLEIDVKSFLAVSLKSWVGAKGWLKNPYFLGEGSDLIRRPMLL